MLLSPCKTVPIQIIRSLNETAANRRRYCLQLHIWKKQARAITIRTLPKRRRYVSISLQNSADPDQTPSQWDRGWFATSLFTIIFIKAEKSNNYNSATRAPAEHPRLIPICLKKYIHSWLSPSMPIGRAHPSLLRSAVRDQPPPQRGDGSWSGTTLFTNA